MVDLVLVQQLPAPDPLNGADVLPLGQGATELNKVTLDALAAFVRETLPDIRDGVDGKTLYSGEGAPTAALGNVGDFYIDAGLLLYGPKAVEGWPAGTPIKGKSAYEIALDNGFVGTQAQWLDSIYSGAPTYAAQAAASADAAAASATAADASADAAAASLADLNAKIGMPNGIAPTGADNKIPASFLPSFVDDVVEVASYGALPLTGEASKLYITTDTTPAKVWRWSGTGYAEIVASPGTTDAIPEGATNLYFTNARALAAAQGALDAKANLAGASFTGKLSAAAPTGTASGFNVGYGTSPGNNAVDGDLWSTSLGLFFRVNGVNDQVAGTAALALKSSIAGPNTFTGTSQRFRDGLIVGKHSGETQADTILYLKNTNFYNRIILQSTSGDPNGTMATYGQILSSPTLGVFFDFDNFRVRNAAGTSTYLTVNTTSGTLSAFTVTAPSYVMTPGAEPAAPVNGQIWYDSTLNKFRKRENGVTSDLDTTGGAGGSVSDTAYGVTWDASTTTAPSQNAVYDKFVIVDAAIAARASLSGGNAFTGVQTLDQGNVTNQYAVQITNIGAGTSGLRFAYAASGTFDIGGRVLNSALIAATNRAITYNANGGAYDTAPFGHTFLGASAQNTARGIILAKNNTAGGTGDFFQAQDSTGAVKARVKASGESEFTAVALTSGAEPAALANGLIWYDGTLNKFRKHQNGATSDLDTLPPASTDALPEGATNLYFTNARALAAAQSALDAKAPLDSPALTGNPTAPTPTAGDNDTSIATTAFVGTALTGRLLVKGNFDCAANPNFPAGTAGDIWNVSNAGKIGGASGKPVDVGDVFYCKANTAAGDQATVGGNWLVLKNSGVARPTIATPSASFTAADADNNSHKVASGASQTLTLGDISAGTSFTVRFTTAWSLSCAGGMSKNGAAPAGVTTGSVAANSVLTFLHEGSGVWLVTGAGLT